MTKEQAIVIIENEKECVKRANNCNRDCYNCELVKTDIEILTALDMAIKALEQQPSEDCVSRQAVIDNIDSISKHHGGITDIRLVVTQLPPVTPTHGICKDCKHVSQNDDNDRYCGLSGSYYDPNFYCADFEK